MADGVVSVAEKALGLARNGDVNCIKLILKHVVPQRNGRPIDFNLPPITGVHDFVPAMAAIYEGINDGSLTPEEASQLIHIVECYEDIIKTRDRAVLREANRRTNESYEAARIRIA